MKNEQENINLQVEDLENKELEKVNGGVKLSPHIVDKLVNKQTEAREVDKNI